MQRSQPAGGLFSIFLNVKALVDPFNKEEALVEAFSVIVKSSRTFVYSSNEVSRGSEAVGVSHLYLPGVEHHVGDTGVGQGGDQLLVAVLGQEEHGEPLQRAEGKAEQALEVEKPTATQETVPDILISRRN